MAEKSSEEFQKDILNILKQQGEKLDDFKKEVREELKKKPPEVAQKEQIINKESDYSYITQMVASSKKPLPQEEANRRVKELSKIMSPLMKQYKLSKLECFVIKIYE